MCRWWALHRKKCSMFTWQTPVPNGLQCMYARRFVVTRNADEGRCVKESPWLEYMSNMLSACVYVCRRHFCVQKSQRPTRTRESLLHLFTCHPYGLLQLIHSTIRQQYKRVRAAMLSHNGRSHATAIYIVHNICYNLHARVHMMRDLPPPPQKKKKPARSNPGRPGLHLTGICKVTTRSKWFRCMTNTNPQSGASGWSIQPQRARGGSCEVSNSRTTSPYRWIFFIYLFIYYWFYCHWHIWSTW